MQSIAFLLGALAGVIVRMAVDRPSGAASDDPGPAQGRSLVCSVLGAALLGTASGVMFVRGTVDRTASAVAFGLSAAILTFCLACAPMLRLVRERGRQTLTGLAIANAGTGLAAGGFGVILGAVIAG